jgi:chromate transport protein ChrA
MEIEYDIITIMMFINMRLSMKESFIRVLNNSTIQSGKYWMKNRKTIERTIFVAFSLIFVLVPFSEAWIFLGLLP